MTKQEALASIARLHRATAVPKKFWPKLWWTFINWSSYTLGQPTCVICQTSWPCKTYQLTDPNRVKS